MQKCARITFVSSAVSFNINLKKFYSRLRPSSLRLLFLAVKYDARGVMEFYCEPHENKISEKINENANASQEEKKKT